MQGEMLEIAAIGTSYRRVRCLAPRQIEQMKASLTAHGQLTALVVVKRPKGPELIDGFKRHRAAEEMGWTKLRVTTMEVGRPGAVGGDAGVDSRDLRILHDDLESTRSSLCRVVEALASARVRDG